MNRNEIFEVAPETEKSIQEAVRQINGVAKGRNPGSTKAQWDTYHEMRVKLEDGLRSKYGTVTFSSTVDEDIARNASHNRFDRVLKCAEQLVDGFIPTYDEVMNVTAEAERLVREQVDKEC